jgi:glycosyltransferase involved in cell wall biosynthesis
MIPLVTIITATTGSDYLAKNIQSVKEQSYTNIQHLVVVDGHERLDNAKRFFHDNLDVINLPYATGIEQYNGHRIYGGCTYFAKGDYIIYLDEDNWLEPEHVEELVKVSSLDEWSYSLRKIVDSDGNYICNDDCESLGDWESILNDYFVDVNCCFIPRKIALQLTPIWYRRARHPNEQPEVDRLLTFVLRQNKIKTNYSGKYTVNYRAGNRADSVQAQFFINGNKAMMQKYNGNLPWRI